VTEQRLTPSEAPDAGAVQSLPAPRLTVHEPQLPGALSAPPERTLIDIVRDTAARYPDASALDDGHRSLSYAQLMDEVRATVAELGLPVVIRPSFTMGGLGSGMAHTEEDLERLAGGGLAAEHAASAAARAAVKGAPPVSLRAVTARE